MLSSLETEIFRQPKFDEGYSLHIFSGWSCYIHFLLPPTSTGLTLNVGAQLLYIADTENGRVRVLDLNSGTIRRGSQSGEKEYEMKKPGPPGRLKWFHSASAFLFRF